MNASPLAEAMSTLNESIVEEAALSWFVELART